MNGEENTIQVVNRKIKEILVDLRRVESKRSNAKGDRGNPREFQRFS